MTPDMSVDAMLDQFIFIVKGSRVIDRKATDWSVYYWLDEKLFKSKVYSLSEMRNYFRHRIKHRIEYGKRVGTTDPFKMWLTHPHRFTEPTLAAAMRFAGRAVAGLVEPRIDLDEMTRRYIARICAEAEIPPPWLKQSQQSTLSGQLTKAIAARDARLAQIHRQHQPMQPVA